MAQAWFQMVGLRAGALSLALAVAALLPADLLAATMPRVGFDAAGAVECRDVTTREFSAVNPGEKVIEARFRISILFEEGKQEHLEDVMLVIESPEKRLRVTDFSPKTELGTDVSGPIEATEVAERTNTAGGTIGAAGMAHYGVANASLSDTKHQKNNRTYKQLPAKYLLLASGTTLGEHGVFFKIKASPQTSLEGAKEFTCWFVVPKSWRGDWCLLSCKARAYRKNYLVSKLEMCGQADVVVGLYLAGDEQGKALARRLDRMQMVPQYSPQLAAAQAQLAGSQLSMSTVAAV
ncbi:MAG TPA: hypothetical protein VHY20_14340, partial [Pirellulales bacterium]|nr:hypothetical protein [Pirellulales bacterium]